MITNGFSETSGSLGKYAPQRDVYKSPTDKVNDYLKDRRALKNLIKEKEEIDVIKNKPQSERTLEEKIKLASYNAKDFLENLPKPEPKYVG